ncbi:hypothetical protein BDV09DRAFT_19430 [Aspergillus tetrazonus]
MELRKLYRRPFGSGDQHEQMFGCLWQLVLGWGICATGPKIRGLKQLQVRQSPVLVILSCPKFVLLGTAGRKMKQSRIHPRSSSREYPLHALLEFGPRVWN